MVWHTKILICAFLISSGQARADASPSTTSGGWETSPIDTAPLVAPPSAPVPSPLIAPPATSGRRAALSDFDQLGPFKIEAALKRRVQFWIDVYSKYSRYDMVFHDARYPHIVFGMVPTKAIRENAKIPYAQRMVQAKQKIEATRRHIVELFKGLAEKEDAMRSGTAILNAEEKKIVEQYADIHEPNKFSGVAKGERRIRGQYGLKESFLEGLYASGRYLPGMQQIATRLGVPPEIAYLPFLESGFDQKAMSKVGASGLWQFMPSTGKFFLRIDGAVDERNDPMKAAEGAALLMRDNFAALEEWPLAITAYNHGRAGVARAVRTVKSTSLAKIIESYDGPNFGFASANFFSAYIAALHVAQNSSHYFGEVEKAEPMVYEEFTMPEYMDVNILTKNVGIDLDEFKAYNPGLTEAVWKGNLYIPVGYTVRIPFQRKDDFMIGYKSIPNQFRFSKQKETAGAVVSAPAAKEEHL